MSLLLFTGCAEFALQQEKANLEKVAIGTSKEDVLNVMGAPNNITSNWPEDRIRYNDSVIIVEENRVVHKASVSENWRMNIDIEAFYGDTPKIKNAKVLPSVKGMGPNDLEFLAVKKVVEGALKERGYRISEKEKDIDTVVFVNFGISDPKVRKETWTTPVYDYVASNPPPQAQTTHQVYNQYGQNLGSVQSNTTYGNPYAIIIPQPVYRGESTHQQTIKSYVRHLVLEAVDYKQFKINKNEMKYYWKVTATSEGGSNNLMERIPYLTMISSRFIEKNSNGKQQGFVYENDPRALRLINGDLRLPASKK